MFLVNTDKQKPGTVVEIKANPETEYKDELFVTWMLDNGI